MNWGSLNPFSGGGGLPGLPSFPGLPQIPGLPGFPGMGGGQQPQQQQQPYYGGGNATPGGPYQTMAASDSTVGPTDYQGLLAMLMNQTRQGGGGQSYLGGQGLI